MSSELPPGLVAYKRTPEFDENTLPAGLKKAHSTKAGVWGVIHILEGRLIYRSFVYLPLKGKGPGFVHAALMRSCAS
jgi:tellurite resistance-related uncharacterized protein